MKPSRVTKKRKAWDYVLTPAYGHKYRNVTELRADFYNGTDFIANGVGGTTKYCSIRDIPEGSTVQVRYGNGLRKATILEVG